MVHSLSHWDNSHFVYKVGFYGYIWEFFADDRRGFLQFLLMECGLTLLVFCKAYEAAVCPAVVMREQNERSRDEAGDRKIVWSHLDMAGHPFFGMYDQRPERRSRERDEKAIREWKERTFPRLKKWAQKHAYLLGFQDESGISERPFVSRT